MKSYFNNEISNKSIIERIEKYKCISFDVFDTLIKRNVAHPSDLFKLIGKEIEKRFGIKDFDKIRYESEMVLYAKGQNVTLPLIYDEISKTVSSCNIYEMMQLEVEYEVSFCQANSLIKEVYDRAVLLGKKIIAISDMYLSKDVVQEILKNCGYDIQSVYVSCEYQKSKKNGSLFKFALFNENLSKKEVLHIGDSWRADYLSAKLLGIDAHRICRTITRFNTKRFIKQIRAKEIYSVYESIINNNLRSCKSYYEKFGYAFLGPVLFNFCKWINIQCEQSGIEKIFFFSRDGYLIKKVFDKVVDKKYDSRYLCVSRRALRVPYNSLCCGVDDILEMIPPTKYIKVGTVFEYLGLDVHSYCAVLSKLKLSEETEISYWDLKSKYRCLFEELLPDYIEKSKQEMEYANKYLKQEGVSGKFAVVDIGWHNSMQFCLEQILTKNGIQNDVYGLYFGIQTNGFEVRNAKGFIRDFTNKETADSVTSFIGLIESFFLEQNGTVIKYKEKNECIVPIREKYEFETESAEYNAYRDMHKGAIAFIDKVCSLLGNENLGLDGFDSFLPIEKFGNNPYMQDVGYFGDFRYFSEGTCYLVGYKGIMYYIKHLNCLKQDLHNARWKSGFLKDILKLNLPYYRIYERLKR